MAETVKTLRRRVRSVHNTKQVTHAMEMISSVKLRRAQAQLTAGRPYSAKLQSVLGHLALAGAIDHPFFKKREVRKSVLVAIAADRGLAGSFNTLVEKRADIELDESPHPTGLICVGKKCFEYFKYKKWPITHSITDFNGILSVKRTSELADRLMEMFLSGQADEIRLLYNSFVSPMVYRPVLRLLLPLEAETLLVGQDTAAGSANIEYILEPNPQRLMEGLLPLYVRNNIFITLADTFTAEHSARMTAMTAATKNCNDLIDSLTLKMNNLRQQAITKEILEVVSGAEALKG
ncbi:MAG: ATP synthase F1 subunit gamma [bacterium]|nr:ATP synthase F1 subunit gamma [Candidatus Sumerlaeota bacterium]